MAIETRKKAAVQNGSFKVNPEINAKLDTFMKEEPGLVQFVKDLPRDQLERKFLLRKMQDRDLMKTYTEKVKAWLAKPEQADLVQRIKSMISFRMNPEQREQQLLNRAKTFIHNEGIRLN